MSSNHAMLKKLQVLRDKLELRKDDISVGEAAYADEARELAGRQEQLALVNGKIAAAVKEMDELGVKGRAQKAEQEEFVHEEESLRHTFSTILEQGVRDVKEERRRRLAMAAKAEAAETEMREVSVLFDDEEAVFRVTDNSYIFDELASDACRFFELHPLDVVLVDDQEERWPGDASVRVEMQKFDNAYGKVIMKMRDHDEAEEEVEDPDNILQLLLKEDEDPEEEPEEDEDEQLLAAAAAGGGEGTAAAASAAIADKQKKKKKKGELNRTQLYKEIPFFLIYTTLFITSLFLRRNVTQGFYQVNAIRTILVEEAFGDYNEKTFMDIANFEEVWEWIENVLVEGLYPGGKYNDADFTKREIGAVMMYNRVVGGIRLRTVRSRPNVNCPGYTAKLNRRRVMNQTGDIYDELFVDECHGLMSAGNEETAPYGPGVDLIGAHGSCEAIPAPPPPPSVFLDVYGVPPTEEQLQGMAVRKLCRAFTWSPAKEVAPDEQGMYIGSDGRILANGPFATNEGKLGGRLGSYPGSGYVRDIDNPVDCRQRPETDPEPNPEGVCERCDEQGNCAAARDDLLLAVDQLKSNLWLDAATRVMYIKVTFYNANLGFFMVIIFSFEFSQGGVITPRAFTSVVNQQLFSTATEAELIVTIIELLTYGGTAYYTFVQLRKAYRALRKTGSLKEYVGDVWNMLECTVLVNFYISMYLRFTLMSKTKPNAVIFEDRFDDFAQIGSLYLETFNFDALCVIALFFKMLKYFQLNISTSMLWSVLVKSGKDVMYFTLMLFILLTGFSMMSVQFFGTTIEGYSMVSKSVIELLLVLLGQFEVEEMQQASPTFGFIFFFIYICVMFLIMMNIFLAILGEAYTVVRSENDEILNNQVQTKKRGLLGYLKLARAIIKAKLAQRKAKKLAARGLGGNRSAELPDANGVELSNAGGKQKGKSVKFK